MIPVQAVDIGVAAGQLNVLVTDDSGADVQINVHIGDLTPMIERFSDHSGSHVFSTNLDKGTYPCSVLLQAYYVDGGDAVLNRRFNNTLVVNGQRVMAIDSAIAAADLSDFGISSFVVTAS